MVGRAKPALRVHAAEMASVAKINDVLEGHVTLEIECVDRILLKRVRPGRVGEPLRPGIQEALAEGVGAASFLALSAPPYSRPSSTPASSSVTPRLIATSTKHHQPRARDGRITHHDLRARTNQPGHGGPSTPRADREPRSPNEANVSQPSAALTARAEAQSAFNGLLLGLGAVALVVGACSRGPARWLQDCRLGRAAAWPGACEWLPSAGGC